MKLAMVPCVLVATLVTMVTVVPGITGYIRDYKGFDSCGLNGWFCELNKNGHTIIYQCASTMDRDARLWLWTARIPSTAKTLVVQNCRHVEIHPDCTKGLRYYSMLEFKAINISHLEFLSPIRSGIFLHDNDQIAQAPPSMTLINVETVNFYPKLFDEPKGGCRYKTFKLNQMSLNNVKIDKLAAFTFNHQEMSNISLTNVTIKTMEPEAMSIIADDIEIQDSTFGLPSNAMQFNATNIIFSRNMIHKADKNGLSARSRQFTFQENHISWLGGNGLQVCALSVKLRNNKFHYLSRGALEGIAPGYAPKHFEIASKLKYEFSGNNIMHMAPGSLHVNWNVYKDLCFNFTIENNTFDCSCNNLEWLSANQSLGPDAGFYELLLKKETGNNTCSGNSKCFLVNVVKQIHHICDETPEEKDLCIHADEAETTAEPTTTETEDLTEEVQLYTEVFPQVNLSLENPDSNSPLKISYLENQITQPNSSTTTWVAVVITIITVGAILTIAFSFWYKKRKSQEQLGQTIFRNEKDSELEDVILINEHQNQMFEN